MHLIYKNLIHNLVKLWTSNFKNLDDRKEQYTLENAVWAGIGCATKAAGHTIPSVYGLQCPNTADEAYMYTVDMWSFWTQYIALGLKASKWQRQFLSESEL